MHIVLWQNALCTFDSSFFAGFLQLRQSQLQKFVCCKCCNSFAKTDVFPINLKNFGWARSPPNHTKRKVN